MHSIHVEVREHFGKQALEELLLLHIHMNL